MHGRQRPLRDARRAPGGGRRRRALPRDVHRRLLQPRDERDRRPQHRDREHGQRPELASAQRPHRGRAVAGDGRRRGARAPPRPRPAHRRAHPPDEVPRRGGPGDRPGPAAARAHARPAPRRPRDHHRRGELVRLGHIRSALDGCVENNNVERYRLFEHRHLDPVRTGLAGDDTIELLVTTRQSGIEIAEAARTRLRCDGAAVEAERRLVERPGYVAQRSRRRSSGAGRSPSRRSWRCRPRATTRSPNSRSPPAGTHGTPPRSKSCFASTR